MLAPIAHLKSRSNRAELAALGPPIVNRPFFFELASPCVCVPPPSHDRRNRLYYQVLGIAWGYGHDVGI